MGRLIVISLQPVCADDEYKCEAMFGVGEMCFSNATRCDHVQHCEDGSDEPADCRGDEDYTTLFLLRIPFDHKCFVTCYSLKCRVCNLGCLQKIVH